MPSTGSVMYSNSKRRIIKQEDKNFDDRSNDKLSEIKTELKHNYYETDSKAISQSFLPKLEIGHNRGCGCKRAGSVLKVKKEPKRYGLTYSNKDDNDFWGRTDTNHSGTQSDPGATGPSIEHAEIKVDDHHRGSFPTSTPRIANSEPIWMYSSNYEKPSISDTRLAMDSYLESYQKLHSQLQILKDIKLALLKKEHATIAGIEKYHDVLKSHGTNIPSFHSFQSMRKEHMKDLQTVVQSSLQIFDFIDPPTLSSFITRPTNESTVDN